MGSIKNKKTSSKGIQIRNGYYVIDKMYKKQRIYIKLNKTSEMALQEANTILIENMHQIDNPDATTQNGKVLDKSSLTVFDALNYLWDKRIQHKKYAKDMKHILSAVNQKLGEKLIIDLVRSDFESYIRTRESEPKKNGTPGCISPRTIQKELQHLSMAINLLVDDGILERNHIKKFILVPQIRPQRIVLDNSLPDGQQWQTLYNCIASSIQPILLTLYETGMRPKEVFHMRWSWLINKGDDQWLIKVPAVDIINGKIAFKEKTGNEHLIPVSAKLLNCFKELGMKTDENTLIFPSPRKGGPRKDIESAFTNALIRSGLKGQGITPYSLRRTRLSIWDSIDPVAGMQAGGHVSKEIHYRHYVNIPLNRLFHLVGIEYKSDTCKFEAA